MPDLQTNSPVVPAARIEGDTLFIAVRGEVDLHNSPELRNAMLDAVTKYAPKKIIINLAEVPYMDSSAIAVLVEALQKLRKTGGKICLVAPQPRVKGLLEIARLDSIFVLVKTEDEATAK